MAAGHTGHIIDANRAFFAFALVHFQNAAGANVGTYPAINALVLIDRYYTNQI